MGFKQVLQLLIRMNLVSTQMVGDVEYTDYISALGMNDAKPSDGEAPVILKLWGMWSTLLLLSLLGPLGLL